MTQLDTAIERLRKQLAKERLDAYEIFARIARSLVIETKRQEVDVFMRAVQSGVAVRVMRDGRVGMASTTSSTPEDMDRMRAQACEALAVMPATSEACVAAGSTPATPLDESVGREAGAIADDEKIEAARCIERAALEADGRVTCARQPRYRESSSWETVINSRGVHRVAERTILSCDVQAVAEQNGESETAWETAHHIDFDQLSFDTVGRTAGLCAVSMLGATPLTTGRYRVYLEPRAAAQLARAFAPSFFADNVQRRTSRLAGKLGTEVVSPLITIIDDGRLPVGAASFPFDAEGVLCGRTILVHRGGVAAWLYDLASAARDGVASTGHAARPTLQGAPQIGMTNLFIEAGATRGDDLRATCEGGVCISEFMGLHTVNTITGDFSLGAVGFVIEGGTPARPFRGVTVAGNLIEMFHRVDGVGDDLRFLGPFGAPAMTVPDVQINGV